jgi:hypothetical protein
LPGVLHALIGYRFFFCTGLFIDDLGEGAVKKYLFIGKRLPILIDRMIFLMKVTAS